MKKNLKLLYDSNEVKRYLVKMSNLNYYDFHTMEFYEKKYFSEISIEELKEMLDTINNENESNSKIQTVGSNNFNVIISLVSIIIAVSISINIAIVSPFLSQVEYSPEYLLNLMRSIFTIMVIYLTLSIVSYINSMKKIHTINKMRVIIKIIIEIKSNAV